MAQNHGFRRAFGTGGKQNDRFFVAAVLVRNAFDFVTQIGVDFAPQADFLAQGFQINDFQSVGFQNLNHAFHFGSFDKCRRVITMRTSAVRHMEAMFLAPTEKFSMTGMRS